ncbi:F-box protein At3g07870-like [Papaver somniferum]|uniref:F-box protein At3g07870-like n=1 Tax=Papaver somniferum TaxID=3469 RepID=UPI000E6FAD8D|nr:F-box protein At3g07870-like [Papaver somniferum]
MHFCHHLHQLYDNDGTKDDNIFAEEEVGLLFAQTTNWDTSLLYGGNFVDVIHVKFSTKEKFKKVSQPPLHNNFSFPHLVGSCNGLVCIFILHDKLRDPIYIFNPITKEEVYLPELVVTERMCKGTSSGFGYISSTNLYKIVRIFYPSHPHKGQIQVYTLGSSCGWRDKGTTSINMETGMGGIHVNGIIYWLGVDSIGSFDLADEEFRFVSVPPFMVDLMSASEEHCGLTSFGGYLCFYDHSQHMKIWSYKKKCGDKKESWCMEFDIQYEDVLGSEVIVLMPLLLPKNNEIIFLM